MTLRIFLTASLAFCTDLRFGQLIHQQLTAINACMGHKNWCNCTCAQRTICNHPQHTRAHTTYVAPIVTSVTKFEDAAQMRQTSAPYPAAAASCAPPFLRRFFLPFCCFACIVDEQNHPPRSWCPAQCEPTHCYITSLPHAMGTVSVHCITISKRHCTCHALEHLMSVRRGSNKPFCRCYCWRLV